MAGLTILIVAIILIFLSISIVFRLCCGIQEAEEEVAAAVEATEPREIDMYNRLERGEALTQRDDGADDDDADAADDYHASGGLVVVTVATRSQGSGRPGGHTTVIAHYDIINTATSSSSSSSSSSVVAVSAAPVRSDELQCSVRRMDRL